MANLSSRELLKPGREWRAKKLAEMIEKKQPVEVSGGKRVVLVEVEAQLKVLRAARPSGAELDSLNFLDVEGRVHKLKDLVKTAEFGGKGERGGVAKEDAALRQLNEEILRVQNETMRPYVEVRVGNETFRVQYAESTPGTPKSDFHLIDMEGKECVWISHKDGRGPRDFQQWGGISQAKEPLVFNHPETKKFVADLKEKYPNGLPSATSLYRKIQDKRLKMISVYGNEFGSRLGRQNVSILLQGPITLVKSGNYYTLNANQVHYNGESVDAGGFEPVFMAIYKGDRSDAGVKGTRIVIMPIAGRRADPF